VSFVFVSHASIDKVRIKPLIEALALQGVKLWIDRPGSGATDFNFDQAFIERYGILGISSGKNYADEISKALKECGVVLACLSRALCMDKRILVQELVIGSHAEKLVACVVDDMPFSEIPHEIGGLIDVRRLQATRINPSMLRQPLGGVRERLAEEEKQQWDRFANLLYEIRRKLPQAPTAGELNAASITLLRFPIFPVVPARDIPPQIAEIYAAHFPDPARARTFLSIAMRVRLQSNPEDCTEKQILVGNGEVLNPFLTPSEGYWEDVLQAAGGKSPRTLAALLITPGAPNPDNLSPALGTVISQFLQELEGYSSKKNS
jgi:hypothetical protein